MTNRWAVQAEESMGSTVILWRGDSKTEAAQQKSSFSKDSCYRRLQVVELTESE